MKQLNYKTIKLHWQQHNLVCTFITYEFQRQFSVSFHERCYTFVKFT